MINIIFGTGDYGNKLFELFKKSHTKVDYFCQSIVSVSDVNGVSVISIDQLEKIEKFNIFIAIGDRKASNLIRAYISNRYNDKAIVYECKDFIEQNIRIDNYDKYCMYCGNTVKDFISDGVVSPFFSKYNVIGGGFREKARCPVCNSKDRERWILYILIHFTNIFFSSCSVLHFAAEKNLSSLISANINCDYYTADIQKGRGMHVVDMTNIQFKDQSFDFVIANHVLEHIKDEKKAIYELMRVIKHNGIIILSFPICKDIHTEEELVEEELSGHERLVRFGQEDHVRIYGYDYKERLERYGLKVDIYSPKDILTKKEIERFGFIENDICMICRIV